MFSRRIGGGTIMKTETSIEDILQVIPNPVVIIDSYGIVRFFNKAAETIFQLSADEIIGENLKILMPEPYRSAHDGFIQRYLEGGAPKIIGIGREVEGIKKDGTQFPVHLSVAQITYQKRIAFIGILTDISKLKDTEQSLRHNQDRYRLLEKASHIGLWEWDIPTGDVFWSDLVPQLFGQQSKNVETSFDHFIQSVHPDDREIVLQKINESLQKGTEYNIEHRTIWPDGSIHWLGGQGNTFRDENDNPILMMGVVQDITARKQIEIDLRQAKDKAESGAKAKSNFLSNMSHEIRTPMNSILGYIQLSLENQDLPEKVQQYLEIAKTSATSLLTIIDDILDISRLESGKILIDSRLFYLPKLLQQTVEMFDLQRLDKQLRLKVLIPEELEVCCSGDDLRIKQVLINLVGNAIKFTENGEITVSVNRKSDGDIHFSIQDTGIGMTNGQLQYIFEPFTQADSSTIRKFGGTGLGTTISRQLVEMMGGKIWAESQLGVGSTFHFVLPLVTIDCDSECNLPCTKKAGTEQTFDPNLSKKLVILVVEDIQENSTLVKLRLEQIGHQVICVEDGRTAIEAFQSHAFDLILMDVHMPVMDGFESTAKIRELEKGTSNHIPIFALTASVMPEEIDKCLQVGMDSVISKPIDFNLLDEQISQLFSRKFFAAAPYGAHIHSTSQHIESTLQMMIEGVNFKEAIKVWRNPSAYVNSLLSFSKRYQTVSHELRAFIKKEDYDAAKKLTHGLKGASSNLQTTNIYQLSQIIEQKIEAREGQIALDYLPELAKEMDALQRSLLKAEKEIVSVQVSDIEISNKDILKMGEILIRLFSQSELDDELFQKFISGIQHQITDEKILELKHSIHNFNFENAVAQVTSIIENFR